MNLLITGAWQHATDHFGELQRKGHSICFLQQEKDALPCSPEWVEGVICNGLFLHHHIAQFPNLRFIQLTSAGFDRVNMDYVRQHNITIHNAGATYAIPMAEHVIGGILALFRQLHKFYCNQQLKLWCKERYLPELCGKNVLILGCGAVGQACATRFQAFGCRVSGIARSSRPIPGFSAVHTLPELPSLLPKADIVVLALPATDDTAQLFNADMVARMNPKAILVNVARGALIDESALTSALTNGIIAGAVLDVFSSEPLPTSSSLWNMPNVIITPHNSFVGHGNQQRLADIIIQKL